MLRISGLSGELSLISAPRQILCIYRLLAERRIQLKDADRHWSFFYQENPCPVSSPSSKECTLLCRWFRSLQGKICLRTACRMHCMDVKPSDCWVRAFSRSTPEEGNKYQCPFHRVTPLWVCLVLPWRLESCMFATLMLGQMCTAPLH